MSGVACPMGEGRADLVPAYDRNNRHQADDPPIANVGPSIHDISHWPGSAAAAAGLLPAAALVEVLAEALA